MTRKLFLTTFNILTKSDTVNVPLLSFINRLLKFRIKAKAIGTHNLAFMSSS